MYLVVRNLSAGTSFLIVDRTGCTKELLANADIDGLSKALYKERRIAIVEGERSNGIFETSRGGHAGLVVGEHLSVCNLS